MIGAIKRLVHQFRHLAAIDGAAKHHLERHLVGTDQVATTKVNPVDSQMRRDMIHQTFHHIVGLGTAGAAIGVHGGRVRHHAKHPQTGCLDRVGCGQGTASRQGRNIGAEIRQP